MTSIRNVLTTAAAALRTQQKAMSVVSHNIANASTEGYSRQRAVITANPSLITPDGVFGMGVKVSNVEQVRDTFLDRIYYRETSLASEHGARASTLRRIESVLGEPSDQGLAATLDAFFSAWSELASNPASTTIRSVVRQNANNLAGKIQELAAGLDSIREDTEDRLEASVAKVSALTSQIADVNRQIVSSESGGGTAGDLRDFRNRAISQLAQLLPIQLSEHTNGSVGVTTSGLSIVDGTTFATVDVRQVSGKWGIGIVGRTGLLSNEGGALGGYLKVVNTDLPGTRQSLDDLTSALVGAVNTAHATGTNPLGNTGVSFFDPAKLTASTIALSATITADVKAISAGTPDGSGGYRAGENDVALLIGALRDASIVALGNTVPGHFQGLVSSIGQVLLSESDALEVHQILADQSDIERASFSGVSLDEELVKLLQFQTAYQAAARMITAADDMMAALLSAV